MTNFISSGYTKEIYGYIWNKRTNSAYVVPETAVNLIRHSHVRDPSNRQLFYVLQEKFSKFIEWSELLTWSRQGKPNGTEKKGVELCVKFLGI